MQAENEPDRVGHADLVAAGEVDEISVTVEVALPDVEMAELQDVEPEPETAQAETAQAETGVPDDDGAHEEPATGAGEVSDNGGTPASPAEEEAHPAAIPGARDHLALVADAERVLDAVDRALTRLRDGSYGSCEICNDAISDADLESDPTAERCSRHLPMAHPA